MIEDSDIINSVQVPQLVKDKFLQNGILEIRFLETALFTYSWWFRHCFCL